MNVLVSGEFQQQARTNEVRLDSSLKDVIQILERVKPTDLDSDSRIKKLPETEDIYVLKHGGLRFFLTRRGDEVVLLRVAKS